MEENVEEQIIAQTSNETLSGLRELTIECRSLLHQLSVDTNKVEAEDLMASFNIWAANMGVFSEGRQSLTFRLKSAPDISKLVQQLLVALKRDLGKVLLRTDSEEDSSPNSDSDDSSDRSSTSSYRQFQAFEDEEVPLPPQITIWTPVQNIITSLRQLALTVRLAGAQHRQERIQRFKNLDRNKETCQLFERYARQTVDFQFPNASQILRERTAVSIATRRARFLYLEQHQKKISTLNEPAPELHPNEVTGDEQEISSVLHPKLKRAGSSRSVVQPSEVLSSTIVTKLDLKQPNPNWNKIQRAESVSSVKIPTSAFPSIPKLDPGGTSFTCPYCLLVCPAKEGSGHSQWRNHLIHDFEPFFCIFDDCSSPFICADTYTGWLAHMRDEHTQPEWHCWYCKNASPSPNPFSASVNLESHLKKHHREEVPDSLRPTLVKHSMIHDQHALRECPFCGGFPEEIEKKHHNRDSEQARESLTKHVRDHLIHVALILAPLGTGEPPDSELDGEFDDTKSEEAQGDIDSKGKIVANSDKTNAASFCNALRGVLWVIKENLQKSNQVYEKRRVEAFLDNMERLCSWPRSIRRGAANNNRR
ncbi:hypothetical protein F4680DRAFT_126310 [Xylaria scruposa]|nr:hypothetical protein F4680DRAFT_126310 [Xylaria scruposa]